MAKRMFEFVCVKGHNTEKYVDETVTVVECAHCGNDASRIISTPRIGLDGICGDFPTASDAWVRRRESHMRKERKSVLTEHWQT
jgi:hypothetical protein